jgi:glutathione S-transferase
MTMPTLILHQYAMSPFAEKARLMLGYKGLPWRAVTVPATLPKPDVVALTGGYRRTPFLQVGADIYCDTALIADVLEHLQPEPALYPAHFKGAARVFAQWADTSLFWAAMTYSLQPTGARQLFEGLPGALAKAFAEDRRQMREGMFVHSLPEATAAYRSYLRRIATMVEEHPFLFGDAPCVADFAAYHPLWFTRHAVPALAGILDATPTVLEWMDRMAAIGHGTSEPLGAAEAIAMAAANEPEPLGPQIFQDEHGIERGAPVTVAAESFGTEPTAGTLLAATRTRLTLARTDPRAGTVHVHFPRIGYILRKANP